MEMTITLPGGDRVDAQFEKISITTNQDGTAPSPFHLFLMSIGTCAGFYVNSFCRQRRLPTDGIRLRQRNIVDEATHLVSKIEIDVELPPDFPQAYRDAAIRAARSCTVKKHLERPPAIEVKAV